MRPTTPPILLFPADAFSLGVNGYADWFVPNHANAIKTPTSGASGFDLAKRVKAKYVRVYQRSNQTLSANDWFTLLEEAKTSKLKISIVTNLSDGRFDELKTLLDDKRIAQHPAWFSLDYGEMVPISDQSLYGMRRMYELVRAKAPQVVITAGGWVSDPLDPRTLNIARKQDARELVRFIDYIDYVSVQAYNLENLVDQGDLATKQALSYLIEPLVAAAKSKPIAICEFGAPSTKAPNDFGKIGTPELAAKAYTQFLAIAPQLPPAWKVRVAFAYTLLDDGTPSTTGWGLFTDKGEKRTPAANVLRDARLGGTP